MPFLFLSFLDSLVHQVCVSAESGLLCAGEAPDGTRGNRPSGSAGGGLGGPVSPAGTENRAAGPGRPCILLSTASCGAFSHPCEPGFTTCFIQCQMYAEECTGIQFSDYLVPLKLNTSMCLGLPHLNLTCF